MDLCGFGVRLGLHDLWHPEANTSNNKRNQHQPTQLSCSMSVSTYVPMRICMGIWWGDGQAGRNEAALSHFDLHCVFWCCIMLIYVALFGLLILLDHPMQCCVLQRCTTLCWYYAVVCCVM